MIEILPGSRYPDLTIRIGSIELTLLVVVYLFEICLRRIANSLGDYVEVFFVVFNMQMV